VTVSGLVNGDSYTFTVTATNAVGPGLASEPSDPVTPADVPGAPSGVSAARGAEKAIVTFSPPAADNGSPVTSYTVTAHDKSDPADPSDGKTVSGTSPVTVAGLTNGDNYTFTVTATNAVGTGPASDPSDPVTPADVPGAPSGVSAVRGPEKAIVTFSAPGSDNGSAVTAYTVTAHDKSDPSDASDGKTVGGSGSPVTVAGLVNGDSYTFTVTATNAVGTGTASDPSDPVTPADVPGAPSAASATRGPGKVTVSFTASGSDNGSTVTSYTVTAHDKSNPTDPSDGKTVSGSASPVTVSGLVNGDDYTFTVTATNAVGTGPASDPSDPITPADVPGAPDQVSAVASDGQAIVSFAPPADHGSPITGYEVTAHETSPAGGQTSRLPVSPPASGPNSLTASGPKSPITLTGLVNGRSYTFTVKALNAAGTGPASQPSDAVIPTGVPGAPTGVSAEASDSQAVVSFTAPGTDNGSPVTGYEVTAHDKSNPGDAGDGKTVTGATGPIAVSGLVNGHTYTFTVTARNAVGTGPASEPSAPVTPSARRTPSSPDEPAAGAPKAETKPANNVKTISVTVAGMVDPEGLATAYRFEFGTSTRYGSTTPARDAGAGSEPVPVSANLKQLKPNTVYHYRLVATSSAGTASGADLTFKTSKGSRGKPQSAPRGNLVIGHRSTTIDRRGTRVVLRCAGDAAAVCSGRLWLEPTSLLSRLQVSANWRKVAFKLGAGEKKRLYLPLPAHSRPQLVARRKAVVRAVARFDDRSIVKRLLTVFPR
jgi:hypothetical protein